MGTIFKYNNQLLQCRDLKKKLKKMHLLESDVEIIKDNIPNDILEKEFVNYTKVEKPEEADLEEQIYYIYQNSKGNYLWGINKPSLKYIEDFGFDISDYKLIDTCKGSIKKEYYKWNPETKTGLKSIQ